MRLATGELTMALMEVGLDDKYRAVFVLRDIEGFSVREAADLLGISEANVKVRLLRARLALREVLTRAFGDAATRDRVGVVVIALDLPARHDVLLDAACEAGGELGLIGHRPAVVFELQEFAVDRARRFDGQSLPGFPYCIDQVIFSAPSVGDVDDDRRPDIVFGTGTFWQNRQHRVYALRHTGQPLTGWPVTVEGEVVTSPALADLDGAG